MFFFWKTQQIVISWISIFKYAVCWHPFYFEFVRLNLDYFFQWQNGSFLPSSSHCSSLTFRKCYCLEIREVCSGKWEAVEISSYVGVQPLQSCIWISRDTKE